MNCVINVFTEHIIDKVCSCVYCQMLDVMFGDPTLTPWAKRFIASVSRQGWLREYSPKQKYWIKTIFNRQHDAWVANAQNHL